MTIGKIARIFEKFQSTTTVSTMKSSIKVTILWFATYFTLFRALTHGVDAKPVVETLIEQWVDIKNEVISRSFNRVYFVMVNLTTWLTKNNIKRKIIILN